MLLVDKIDNETKKRTNKQTTKTYDSFFVNPTTNFNQRKQTNKKL